MIYAVLRPELGSNSLAYALYQYILHFNLTTLSATLDTILFATGHITRQQ